MISLEDNRINPIIVTRPDFCYVCMKPHVLEVYTVYNKPIGFSALLNFNKKIGEVINVPLSYGRCRNCGTKFHIFWEQNGTLRLTNDSLAVEEFVNQFKDFEIGDVSYACDYDETKGLSRD